MIHMQRCVLSLIGSIVILLTACGKSPTSSACNDTDPAKDSTTLLFFAKTHGIGPLKDTLGLYYQVIAQGSGATPAPNSTIFVTYTGTLMDSTVFDSQSDASKTGFSLGNLIPGWQIGLPKIQVGGHIKLLIPSKYGYGCVGSGASIPPNSPIFFDITLVSIQ
jgi:FKBP-type peptidyl-prolyl cis-trans isomerase FkpA